MMGFYIETGTSLGKAEIIIIDHKAVEISMPKSLADIPADKAVICVVNNVVFDAAAYCFSENELKALSRYDGRAKRWLLMDKTLAEKLSGYV